MRSLKTALVICCLILPVDIFAQFNPYNPYGNPWFQLGQQIGNSIAQNNKYGRNKLCKAIKKWGECNNGTLSLEHGAVAIYGTNGYYYTGAVDDRLSSKLKSINKAGGTINDVNILENGQFIIVYNNGKEWYGVIPSSLKSALNDYYYGTVFKSVAFNENGTYAITTDTGFKSNNSIYQEFYDDNVEEYGELLSVSIIGDGAVFCYSDGVRFCGRIPNEVISGVKRFTGTARFVKYNKHGDYLICSKYGSYSYSIGDANAGKNSTTTYYDYAKERKVKAKEKAYAKWVGKAIYKYDEDQVHRVWCNVDIIDVNGDKYVVSLKTSMGSEYNSAPTLNIDIMTFREFKDISEEIPFEGLHGESLKIILANGETITSNNTAMFQNWLGMGFRLSTSLVNMRSDRRSLSGTDSSVKYLVGQFSYYNIKSITFKGNNTIDFSGIDTKTQLCYDFHRLAEESGRTNIIP